MTTKVQQQGEYERFMTTHEHHILVLNDHQWFAWVEGQESPILVKSDSDHKKDRTISMGRFYLIDFDGDPDFRDMPHLFLQQGDHYQQVILPNGLPTEQDKQKRLVKTDENVSENTLKKYVNQ